MKTLKELKGTKELSKKEQKLITGGIACDYDHPCPSKSCCYSHHCTTNLALCDL
jgi:hypothetical protein